MTPSEFLCTPAGVALLALFGFALGVYSARPPRPTPVEVERDDDDGDDDERAELVAAAREAAAHRWPDLHQAEAFERYTVDLRCANHYRRDEAREREAARAAAAAKPTTYATTSLDVTAVDDRVEGSD